MAKTRRRYDDEFRAGAIALMEAAGYPDTPGALAKVAAHLHLPDRTLTRWWHGKNNPPPDKLVTLKKKDLREAIAEELNDIFTAMSTKREEASYRDLGTVAGILMDKQQLLNDKPTERIAHEHSGTLTVDERRQRITELLDTARSRRTSDAAGSGIRHTDD